MVLGESRIANSVLRMMGDDNRNAIDNYINEVCKKKFLVMDSREQINNIFGTSLDNFFECLSENDLSLPMTS